jgi:hypothetical protein
MAQRTRADERIMAVLSPWDCTLDAGPESWNFAALRRGRGSYRNARTGRRPTWGAGATGAPKSGQGRGVRRARAAGPRQSARDRFDMQVATDAAGEPDRPPPGGRLGEYEVGAACPAREPPEFRRPHHDSTGLSPAKKLRPRPSG